MFIRVYKHTHLRSRRNLDRRGAPNDIGRVINSRLMINVRALCLHGKNGVSRNGVIMTGRETRASRRAGEKLDMNYKNRAQRPRRKVVVHNHFSIRFSNRVRAYRDV